MIPSLLSWFTDPANWSGADGIPHRLLEHVRYTAVVLVIAAAIAIPVGLWVGHSGRGRWLVTAANSLRAVPTLGLLFVVVLWLGPLVTGELAFTLPSIVVLVLLAVPPLLAGAYAGIENVDPGVRDAARGVGMTPVQQLLQVELPGALPLLFSGVRAATLQVVATATIAAYVGLGGLGRYLVDGIALSDYPRTAGGAVLVAALAVLLDAGLALVQRRSVSAGIGGSRGRAGRVRDDRDAGGAGLADGGAGRRGADDGASGRSPDSASAGNEPHRPRQEPSPKGPL
ncbi:MAG: ABC transporter permease [Dermatophilaceae bacterium]